MTPVGLNNMQSIIVADGICQEEYIEIPVKMRQGFYSPYLNAFDSDLSLEELCELFANNDIEGVKEYEIFDDVAYLTKSIDDKVVARTVLYDRKGDDVGFEYDLSDMQVKGCTLPVYLFDEIAFENIADDVAIYTSLITQYEITNWLSDLGYTVNVTVNIITTSTCIIEFREENTIAICMISDLAE